MDQNKTTEEKVIDWAQDRNIIKGSSPYDQMEKLIEEVHELEYEIEDVVKYEQREEWDKAQEAHAKALLELGDGLVVYAIIANQLGTTIEACLSRAYEKIKDRKGRLIDGIFVKEEDL